MIRGIRARRDAKGRPIDLTAAVRLIELIVGEFQPEQIWLFGSRARGHGDAASDWDFLVVVPDDAPEVDDPIAGWRLQKEAGVPSDVVLCRLAEFEDARETPNTIAYEAAHHGVQIYGR